MKRSKVRRLDAAVVADAVNLIQDHLHQAVLAVILLEDDGALSVIPNPILSPADVMRAIGGQGWEAMARVVEEFVTD